MSEPRTKLRLALEAAKAKLEGREVDHEANTVGNPPPSTPPASKLNILLGTSHTPKERVPLFQRVGLAQRPTYDLLATPPQHGTHPMDQAEMGYWKPSPGQIPNPTPFSTK